MMSPVEACAILNYEVRYSGGGLQPFCSHAPVTSHSDFVRAMMYKLQTYVVWQLCRIAWWRRIGTGGLVKQVRIIQLPIQIMSPNVVYLQCAHAGRESGSCLHYAKPVGKFLKETCHLLLITLRPGFMSHWMVMLQMWTIRGQGSEGVPWCQSQ